MPNPPPQDAADLTVALNAAGYSEADTTVAVASALPERNAIDIAGALLAPAAYPSTTSDQLGGFLTAVTRFTAADVAQAVQTYFPPPTPTPTPTPPTPSPIPPPKDQDMHTLVEFLLLFPKGNETAIGMSQASPGPFPCPSGDIISPFGMFPPAVPGAKRAYRLKCCYFDENADGDSHVQIGFNMFSGAQVVFDLPRVCSAGGASNFHYSNWYMPDPIDTSYAHAYAVFAGSAIYNNSAGVYSVVIEAHDLPMSDGLRIRDDSNGAIYVMLDGQLRQIPSPDVYRQLFRAEDYDHRPAIAPYPVGQPLAGLMVLANGTPDEKIFLLIDNVKRWIISSAVFDRFGFNRDKIQAMSAEQLNAIPDGSQIG
jgi:hypothetical protein